MGKVSKEKIKKGNQVEEGEKINFPQKNRYQGKKIGKGAWRKLS